MTSCQDNDDLPKTAPQTLFSVNLDNQKFNTDYKKSYIAAYTPKGEFIKYGSLSDSSNWVLSAPYKGDKIDIIFFEIWHQNSLIVNHIKNVNIGQVFTDPNMLNPTPILPGKSIVLEIEDFGNRDGNSTAPSYTYECRPHKHNRGYAHPYGEFLWDKVENGYTYKQINIDPDSKYQGTEIILFERGTNKPYVKHIDIASNSISSGDTITLHKSDFELGETKTVEVNSINNEFNNIFLYTYNSQTDRKDMITSFEDVPNNATEKKIKYVSSTLLPTTFWDFRYFAKNNTTTYTIQTNATIPSTITVQELTGHSLIKNGNKSNFTHSTLFPEKKHTRTIFTCSKRINGAVFSYSTLFDTHESIGNSDIVPVQIPNEILSIYTDFTTLNNIGWQSYSYSQIYTNIPGNSSLDFLRNSLMWVDNNTSNSSYSYETFSIKL